MDTGHNTAQHSAQVLTNVYSEGDTLTLHLRNSLLSREHQVMMDIKEGMERISCCCQDIQRQRDLRERGGGHWSLHPPSLSLLLYFIDLLFENN